MSEKHAAPSGKRTRGDAANAYPKDRFDHVPRSGRTGAHRVSAQPRFVWQYVIATVLGTAILTTVGIIGVTILNSEGKLPAQPSQSQSPSTKPTEEAATVDPEATVVVLDGTSAAGDVAARVDEAITSNKWGTIISSGPANETDVEISAVFYSNPDDAAAARGLAEKLGGLSAYTTADYDTYGARLVVLIGQDYAGPGKNDTSDS